MPRVAEQTSCENPTVSVAIITYNHEKFIAQAIESVLMQETDFRVELVVGEDCSTDGTRKIVKAYANKYPNVIRALLPGHNLGAARNFAAVFEACRGKYIACLEGDDYWTDARKLHKQVAIMDLNPQYSMCATTARDVVMLPDGKEQAVGIVPPGSNKGLFNLEDVLAGYPFRTLTYLLRNGLIKLPDWFQKAGYGDMCLLVLYAEKGPIVCLDDVTATYRMHGGGLWSGSSLSDKCKITWQTLDILNEYLSGRYAKLLRKRDFQNSRDLFLEAAGSGWQREAKQCYWKSFYRFAPYMPASYLTLGVSIYGNKYVPAWQRLKKKIAIRSRVRRLLEDFKRHWG